jgi:hypothetical protein
MAVGEAVVSGVSEGMGRVSSIATERVVLVGFTNGGSAVVINVVVEQPIPNNVRIRSSLFI